MWGADVRTESILITCKSDGTMNMYLDEPPESNREYEVRMTSRYPNGKEKENMYRPRFNEQGFAEVKPYSVFCCPVSVVCRSWKKEKHTDDTGNTSIRESTVPDCKLDLEDPDVPKQGTVTEE